MSIFTAIKEKIFGVSKKEAASASGSVEELASIISFHIYELTIFHAR